MTLSNVDVSGHVSQATCKGMAAKSVTAEVVVVDKSLAIVSHSYVNQNRWGPLSLAPQRVAPSII